jgi:ABC-type multidrug transport system fused ATPase/permease subunit
VILLKQDENLSFIIEPELNPRSEQRLDLYFSIPNEMSVNPQTLSEESYFNNHFKSHLAYNANNIHLPLVRSRFVSKNKGEQQDYRQNLNLYCYQVRLALNADVKDTLQYKEAELFYPAAIELCEQTQGLLKKLRRYTPDDEKLLPFYKNADNYLSWHVEQSFLKLLDEGPRSSDYAKERGDLLQFCKAENNYREEQEYNSQSTIEDANRITNKMRLLQRLIEHGVILSRHTRYLNSYLKRMVKGTVTAVIMAFVMLVVLNARSNFTEVTATLILILGVIYGLREIFKEDITRVIWRAIVRGRPKWRFQFRNSITKDKIASQYIWLEYTSFKRIPLKVRKIFSKRRHQNKQAAQWLHFASETQVNAKKFLPGYDSLQQTINFSLAPFARYLKRGEGKLYHLESNKISKQSVERRYQLNLVLVFSESGQETLYQRYKITLNRSKIVNIEQIYSQVEEKE